jgi:hypothetical protein
MALHRVGEKGSGTSNGFFGGSESVEGKVFRMIDHLSYLRTRHGLIERAELETFVPGWLGQPAAVDRRWHRTLEFMREQLLLTILTVESEGEPTRYRFAERDTSPWLRYAEGLGDVPAGMVELPRDRSWSPPQQASAICAVMRTIAFTPQVQLTLAQVEPQSPLTPELFALFHRRWSERMDLDCNHHQAVRFLSCGQVFRVSTLWPRRFRSTAA